MSCRTWVCPDVDSIIFDPFTSASAFELEANPDISGIGVLIGFVVTAWANFFALLIHYFIATGKEPNTSQDSGQPLLDVVVGKSIWKLLKKEPTPGWAKPMETIILAMSDQQLVTGLALMLSGYSQMSCGLSIYHWNMVTNLTWFSTITHISSLPVLRSHFEKHRYMWYVRVFLMFGLAMMLAVGLLLQDTLYMFAIPATCYFHYFNYTLSALTVFNEILLLAGLPTRCFPGARRFLHRVLSRMEKLWCRSLIWACKRLSNQNRHIQGPLLSLLICAFTLNVTIREVLEFLLSGFCAILWLLFVLIWGTIRIFSSRLIQQSYARAYEHEDDYVPLNHIQIDHVLEENTWGFGQLMPVLLLGVPILLAAEGYSELCHSKQDTQSPEDRISSNILTKSQTESQQLLLASSGPVSLSGYHNESSSILTSPTGEGENSNNGERQSFIERAPSGQQNQSNSDDNYCMRCIQLFEKGLPSKLWQRDNQLLILSIAIGCASIVLPFTQSVDQLQAPIFLFIFIPFYLSFCIIPYCAILDHLHRPTTRLSSQHTLSPIRIALDQQRPYRVIRHIFMLCFLLGAVLFAIACYKFSTDSAELHDLTWVVFSGLWLMIEFCFIILCLIYGILSIYTQVVSEC